MTLLMIMESKVVNRINRSEPWILGVTYSHNGAACLLRGNDVRVVVQEERLTGLKRAPIRHYRESLAVEHCLQYAGISLSDVDLLAVCTTQPGELPVESDTNLPAPKQRCTMPHHLGHAYGVFATAGFDEAAVLVIDGQGGRIEYLPDAERANLKAATVPGLITAHEVATIYRGSGEELTSCEKHSGEWIPPWKAIGPRMVEQRNLFQFGSLGGIFSAVAHLIFGDTMEAGKVMGLAPYGRAGFPVDCFFSIDDAGRFHYSDQLLSRFQNLERWPANQGIFADLAASAQAALERGVCALAERARQYTQSNRLCYAGGVALNSIANEQLYANLGFEDIYVMPAAEDSGTALGAAYYGLKSLTGRISGRRLIHDCLGPRYSPAKVTAAIVSTPFIEVVEHDDYLEAAVDRLCNGEVIGWFQGGSELGPRALGQRSILCDARLPDGKDRLNHRVKHREGFRPFAPAILLEHTADWFEMTPGFPDSPVMLRVCRFKNGQAARVPAAAHIDGTGRLQTVTAEINGPFYELIQRFHQRTGVPILLNTSFNVAGEPIVENPEDALWCLLATDLDAVVVEKTIVTKASACRSLLQLYPSLSGDTRTRLVVDRSLDAPPDADRQADAARKAGVWTVTIPAEDLPLLELCTGERSGEMIAEILRPTRGDQVELWARRRLSYYRRRGIIHLGLKPPHGPPRSRLVLPDC